MRTDLPIECDARRTDLNAVPKCPPGPGADCERRPLTEWPSQPPGTPIAPETRAVMAEGLRRLPVELRDVFVLRDIERRSTAEVAELLELPPAVVKSRLHRARIALRDRLNRHFVDSGH